VVVAITDAVRQLIDAGVRSIEQMEILLFLAQDPAKWWPIEAVRRDAILTTQRGQELIQALERSGLVLREGKKSQIRLGPKVDIPGLVALRTSYERDRANVVNAFFASNLASLRSFANAFKLRRNE
jgi:hypothetical protein